MHLSIKVKYTFFRLKSQGFRGFFISIHDNEKELSLQIIANPALFSQIL